MVRVVLIALASLFLLASTACGWHPRRADPRPHD